VGAPGDQTGADQAEVSLAVHQCKPCFAGLGA
jgi:hypothetical protein